MTYLRNTWYQAGWASELSDSRPLLRRLLSQSVLMFHDADGQPQALLDRCPHRFAPLSAGTLSQGIVTCGYHGLAYDGSGACVNNPHGPIGAIRAHSFPLVARHEVLWIWLGDPELADPALIPDLSFIDDTPETARIFGHLPTAADYELIVDNIMDLSHADYLHPTTLGGMLTHATMKVEAMNDRVSVIYSAENVDPLPIFHADVPPPAKADVTLYVDWFAPSVMVLGAGANHAGAIRDPGRDTVTLHSISPETETSSHYFYCSTRPFMTDDLELSASFKITLDKAFVEEDKPMLEKQQDRIGTVDFWSLKPLMLPIDSAGVQTRRTLAKLIAAEAAV
jgi:vanillate O-demethylase monooxygenase subunit